MKKKYFGTDGIRGEVNYFPMTPDFVMNLGKALTVFFKNQKQKTRFLIGKDTRISGYIFEDALNSAICAMGGDVWVTGPLPTPGIAFLTNDMRADAGIVISASHNPFYDNGIKIFNRFGLKLTDEEEIEIEKSLEIHQWESHLAHRENLGRAFRIEDSSGRYIVHLKRAFPKELKLEGIKIAIDCANGATFKVAPAVFEELGGTLYKYGIHPNGVNINDHVGALHPEFISSKVKETGADLGIAFDGDGDRVIFVDEYGKEVDGDIIIAALASSLQERGLLRSNLVVTTVMSNMALEQWFAERGIHMLRSQVGDRYVLTMLLAEGGNFGGESSGHLIFLDYATTGDGILGALLLLEILLKKGTPLSMLVKDLRLFPQKLINIRLEKRIPLDEIDGLSLLKNQFLQEIKGRGRIFIRYSGTEPKLRILLEGEDPVILDKWDSIFHEFFSHQR